MSSDCSSSERHSFHFAASSVIATGPPASLSFRWFQVLFSHCDFRFLLLIALPLLTSSLVFRRSTFCPCSLPDKLFAAQNRPTFQSPFFFPDAFLLFWGRIDVPLQIGKSLHSDALYLGLWGTAANLILKISKIPIALLLHIWYNPIRFRGFHISGIFIRSLHLTATGFPCTASFGFGWSSTLLFLGH